MGDDVTTNFGVEIITHDAARGSSVMATGAVINNAHR